MNLPGLGALRLAKNGEVAIDYQDVDGGAELVYRVSNPVLVDALHKWFDAQLSDHGADAIEGHPHHHGVYRPTNQGPTQAKAGSGCSPAPCFTAQRTLITRMSRKYASSTSDAENISAMVRHVADQPPSA